MRRIRLTLVALVVTVCGLSVYGQVPPALVSGPAGTYAAEQVLSASGPVTLSSPWIGPLGQYTITVPSPVTVSQTANSVTFSWAVGPNPPPGPSPVPPGPPPVPPATGHLWVVPVYEYDVLATVPPGQQAIRVSTTIGSSLTGLDSTFREYDQNNPTISSWSSSWSKISLPALVVIAKDSTGKGTLVEALPLPADEASLVSEIKRLRGAK